MERHIGRHLNQEERVHHLNGIKSDNRLENLLLCKNAREHIRIHNKNFSIINGIWYKVCTQCGVSKKLTLDNFPHAKGKVNGKCRLCLNLQQKLRSLSPRYKVWKKTYLESRRDIDNAQDRERKRRYWKEAKLIGAFLRKGNSVDEISARNLTGCANLVARISLLQREGWDIRRDMVSGEKGKRWARYYLAGE